MEKSRWILVVIALALVALAAFVGVIAFQSDAPGQVYGALGGAGVTNMDSLTLSNDLIVTDDSTLTDDVDVGGELSFGANDLYAVGFATEGQQAVYGTSTMTTTEAVVHGLTTVTFCVASLGEDPETGAGDAAAVSVAVAANACTIKTWQDDFTAATETSVVVHWLVIGAP